MMNVQVKETEKTRERLESYQALLSILGYEDRREEKAAGEPETKGLGTGGGCLW